MCDHPDYNDDFEEECSNCGGEGIIYMCHEEYACIDPEGGCDECARRCDWCKPPRSALPTEPGSAAT